MRKLDSSDMCSMKYYGILVDYKNAVMNPNFFCAKMKKILKKSNGICI